MDLDVFKNNLSPGQENLLLAVESSTLVQVSKQFETLSKSERDENFLDYVLLVTALERGHRSMAKFLLKNGCRVKIPVQTQIFCTPLYYAVELHELDIIKNLIRAGASIYDHDKNKTSPFKLAVQKQQFMAVDFMVDYLMTTHQPRSLDPNCEIDIAVFHMACWRGNRKAVKRFLECRFSASSRSKFDEEKWIGYTPIHFALEGLSQSVAELLLEHDIVDHHAMDHSGKTPLLAAFTNEKFPRKYSDRMIENWVRGVRLDCYTVMVSYVKKLIFNRSFPPEKYTEYFNRLSELYPEKFVLIDSLIFDEVELLRSKMIGHGISLYDLLSKDSTCMARYAKNENLKTMIQSPIFDIEFPIFHDRLRQQFSMGIERNSIYSKAKRALNFVTGQRWPEPCSEQILMYLHNVHLKSLIKSETIVVPPKRARFSTFSLDEPPRKLFRNA
ncbi:hypothetical protein QAD02_015442 [Eretmocerus hayati]|uniref:Uncharacterized protein n=1 Tax=Eretmocerus hayati TaxID=131215 RepID=A0ACC2P8A8_9HYME|nr:hypothetical protein QAD02_015442 [Eretmocerus hayati]